MGKVIKMAKLVSLKDVNASLLPADVLVLLSKYAQAMRKHNGLIIKISSLNVFKHVHKTSKLTENLLVRSLHRELVLTVNNHLQEGTMKKNSDKDILADAKALLTRESQASKSDKRKKVMNTNTSTSRNYFSLNL